MDHVKASCSGIRNAADDQFLLYTTLNEMTQEWFPLATGIMAFVPSFNSACWYHICTFRTTDCQRKLWTLERIYENNYLLFTLRQMFTLETLAWRTSRSRPAPKPITSTGRFPLTPAGFAPSQNRACGLILCAPLPAAHRARTELPSWPGSPRHEPQSVRKG